MAEEEEQKIEVDGSQALVNLIDNAVKYSPAGGHIRIGVFEDGRDAVVEVQDDGPGIPAEHQQRIFERFYRLDKARTRTEGGAGLGLSITQWAVSAHKGILKVESKPGSGNDFSHPASKSEFNTAMQAGSSHRGQ